MPKAIWNGAVIAEAPESAVEIVEGNVYFPRDATRKEYLRASDHTSHCPWKGTASYYDVVVDGSTNPNAAWVYREPLDAARNITDRIAFWHGVQVER